ncbi:MAG: phage protein Gp36 family protein, partial [Bosea sp. (in: a-proteobacteria)]
EIDAYAAARYKVPIAAPVPAILREKCAEIAVLKRFRSRGMLSTEHRERWDAVFSADERNPGWLLQLRSGLVTPGVDPMPERHSTMVPDQATTELSATRDVSRNKLGGFW